MAKLTILGHAFLSYESSLKDIYWVELSELIIKKFGKHKYTDYQEVEEILLFGFDYFIKKFEEIVLSENKFSFFMYVFWLHEESIELYLKWIKGGKLDPITEEEFAGSRRILKAILEQGCDVDLTEGTFPIQKEFDLLNNKIHHLFYVGHWMYQFADHITFQKMIEECHSIEFDENNLLIVDWQHHYGVAYNQLMPLLRDDYERGSYELEIVPEFVQKLNECFSIDYNWAGGIIFEIKKEHNPKDSSLQTIEPWILPKNLAQQFNISEKQAAIFYDGLTISRKNKMTLEDLVIKPHSMNRLHTRPILVYNIDGVDRALVGENKFPESVMVIATNGLKWNSMPSEWSENECMKEFLQQKGYEHDKLFEDEVEKKVKEKNLLFVRNIKSFKQHKGNNINIDNEVCGEVDFLIVSKVLNKIFVVDCKYNKAKYEAVGYRTDYSNFKTKYEPKMHKKHKWVSENLAVVNQHFQIIYNDPSIDIHQYEIETVFFINTPTFYMFNGNYKAIPLNQISEFLDGNYKYPILKIMNKDNEGNEIFGYIEHPYFRKPDIHENN